MSPFLFLRQSDPLLGHGTGTGERAEHFLPDAADRALPVLGQVGEGRTLRDLDLSPFHALVRVVDITARRRLALKHLFRVGHSLLLISSLRCRAS